MAWLNLHDDRGMRIAALAICVLLHLGLGLWLMRPPLQHAAPELPPLQVIWINPELPMPPPPPPPFPTAPPHPASSAPETRAPRRVTRSALQVQAGPSRETQAQAATEPETEPPQAAADIGRLLDAASAIAQESLHQTPISATRNPMQQRRARIPGRDQPFTPSAIVLRKPISPEEIVKTLGRFFGGGYEPCPDTRRRIDDLIARRQLVGEAELRMLIDRERRSGCR